MTSNSHARRPTLGILAVASGLMLASCQTSADEVLSLGEASAAEEASGNSAAQKAFRDPYVSAVSGQVADASASMPSQNETDPARLKRKPVPMAAAYSDIAEPPPEVLALQQQATQVDPPQAASRASADLGDITMQPTNASPRSNSLFSAGQRQQAAVVQAMEPATAQAAAGEPVPSGSLVPNEMPTLGVNAVSKSLFSPSAEQQMLMQQRALEEQARAETAVQNSARRACRSRRRRTGPEETLGSPSEAKDPCAARACRIGAGSGSADAGPVAGHGCNRGSRSGRAALCRGTGGGCRGCKEEEGMVAILCGSLERRQEITTDDRRALIPSASGLGAKSFQRQGLSEFSGACAAPVIFFA